VPTPGPSFEWQLTDAWYFWLMKSVAALVAAVLVVLVGLYASLWWDASSLADAVRGQGMNLLLSPGANYDAAAVARMMEEGGASRELQLDELRIHVGEGVTVRIGDANYFANAVAFEFKARRRNFLGAVVHWKASGVANLPWRDGPRDWPLVPEGVAGPTP
jgi:hypothetical protein